VKEIGKLVLSKLFDPQYWPFRVPSTAIPLGTARMNVPQLQLSRASRPAQRIWVIVVPGGAVNAWPEKAKPA
jgi:hypothetical protein